MASWKWPNIVNKILEDIPGINALLNALLKQDPDGTSDIPSGAKRWADTSEGKQFQVYNASTSSWESVGKLSHDVASVDGFSASKSIVKNAIAVRDSNGDIPGNITGNAATATKAGALSAINPISMGGTGAKTAEDARNNLGASPTDHASTAQTHGIGTSTKWGHLKSSDSPDSAKTASGGWAASPSALASVNDALSKSIGDVQTTANKGVADAAAASSAASAAQTTANKGVSDAAAAASAASAAQTTANNALPKTGGNISGKLTVGNLAVATFNSSGQLVFPNGTKIWIS